MKHVVILILFLSACAHTGEGPGEAVRLAPPSIATDTVWRGAWEISGDLTVQEGATLRVEPGGRLFFRDAGSRLVVSGSIQAAGTSADPVVFAPARGAAERWGGILLTSGSQENILSGCVVRGAAAVTLGGASVKVRDCLFEGNGVALDLAAESTAEVVNSLFRDNDVGIGCRLKSRVAVRKSRFEGQSGWAVAFSSSGGGEVRGSIFDGGNGIVVKQGREVLISGNAFQKTERGILTDQVAHDVRIIGNRFEGGGTGIEAMNFSSPYVACGTFRDFKTAVAVTRFSRPLITDCIFEGNGRGIEAGNKSSFPIRNSVFQDNGEALFLDLSAYPRIEKNNFDGNGKDIVLGIYMSAHWEQEVGSQGISLGRAKERGSQNVGGVARKHSYDGLVDASGNWWGRETTAVMNRTGPEGNIPSIDDVFDRPTVSYPDFGPGEYRLDRVVYSPWLPGPVADAGPPPGGCKDISGGGSVEEEQ